MSIYNTLKSLNIELPPVAVPAARFTLTGPPDA